MTTLAFWLWASIAVPHLMPDGQGSARLVDKRAYILITVPTTALQGVDDDRNGLLNDAEVGAHIDDIKAQLLKLVRFDNGSTAGRTLYNELIVPHRDSSAGVEAAGLTVMRIDEWDSTVTKLGLHADIFAGNPPPPARQLLFRAIRGDSTEVAILSSAKTAHGFFGAQVAADTAGDGGQAFLGLALIVGLFVAYFLQRRAKAQPPPVAAPVVEVITETAPTPRGSSPNWGAPILFCGFLYAAASGMTAWTVVWHLLYFALAALGTYTTFSAKEFAGELARDPGTTRRDHYLKFGVPYVLVPLIAWVLVIVVGWPAAILLPAAPWALLLVVGLVAAGLPKRV